MSCNLFYPVLPSASAFLSVRVACLMICGPLKATILWSLGRGDHKTSTWPTKSALEPLWGAQNTQQHTQRTEKSADAHRQMYVPTYAHLLSAHTYTWHTWTLNYGSFPQADPPCQKPVLSCGPNPMFSLIEGMGAKTIRGSNHSLNHIGFLHTKHFHWEATGRSALGGWTLNEYGSACDCLCLLNK